MGCKAVRTERYKYIQYTDLEGMDDLEADPYELSSLIDSPDARETLEHLKEALAGLLAHTA